MKSLVFFGSLFFLSLGLYAQTSDSTKQKNAPNIQFVKPEHNFGTIAYQANGNCEFEFTNTGTLPLIITRANASCGCTQPTYPQQPIPPGGKGVIKVTYDTKRIGPFVKSISIGHNAEEFGVQPVVLIIRGEVLSPKEEKKNKPEEIQAIPVTKQLEKK